MYSITEIISSPYDDQKPGTSGLRKPTKRFEQNENYTENFIAAILKNVTDTDCSLVIGGDGRYFMTQAIAKIIKLAAAAPNISKLIIGQNGLLSTPAVSNLIIQEKTAGGILLTASHNPGGPDADFGVKFNCGNGGPAPSSVTDQIYQTASTLHSFNIVADIHVDLAEIGTHKFDIGEKGFTIQVVDSVAAYAEMCQRIFDFESIGRLFSSGFKVRFDCMHAVNGPYARRILIDLLNAPAESVCNSIPKPDFNGGHPDPNQTYAKELVDFMQANPEYGMGCAFDGDGDRNMILGASGFFVTPSDSLAIIGEHGNNCIPYFQSIGGIKGIARSMPTSSAMDAVAKALQVQSYEVPTGWKFFGSLMDSGKISLCGEESFGTGSNHIREKDGLWAALAWLSILAKHSPHYSVKDIVESHWRSFGRYYYSRWDYEGLSSTQGSEVMSGLKNLSENFASAKFSSFSLDSVENFSYTDLDGSVASNQGFILKFSENSEYHGRAVVRLSGTGSSGATIRLYLERYDEKSIDKDVQVAVCQLQKMADKIARITEISGREKPTVIT